MKQYIILNTHYENESQAPGVESEAEEVETTEGSSSGSEEPVGDDCMDITTGEESEEQCKNR